MRLGLVTPAMAWNNGQGRVNCEIALEALRRGHDISLFAHTIDGAFRRRVAHASCLGVTRRLPTQLLRDQYFACRSTIELHLRRQDLDAILVNGFVTWAKSDLNAVHFVHSSWVRSDVHPWRLERTAHSLYHRAYTGLNAVLEKHAIHQATTVVAVSGKIRAELLDIGVRQERVVVITNGVDLDQFAPGPSQRTEFGLPWDKPVALFAGDLRTRRKNLETVLRALVTVGDLHLAVAGDTRRSAYPGLVRELGLEARVHFLGFQTNMPALMRSVDMFVFPSRYEACSLVLLEALASGLPIVTARSAGGAEMLTPDTACVLDDAEDVGQLCLFLRAIAIDPALRVRMSAAARRLAAKYSWASMSSRYVDLLEALALDRGRA
jgi:glycosyltransferase involved in cell wall biosynthesis